MLPAGIPCFCQKCLAANPLGQELCVRCGARLMLVVEPRGARFDAGEASVSQEEFLLERVSDLENRLGRVIDRMEQVLDLMLKQAQNSYLDHTLIETLIAVLSEAGLLNARRLNELWHERRQKENFEQKELQRLAELRVQMIAAYSGTAQAYFAGFISEGMRLFSENEGARGVRLLERAAALAPSNEPLQSFIGEYFFRAGKTALARDYLARAFDANPNNPRVCLLLGLSCGDEGETERAKSLLNSAIEHIGKSYAAHYGMGRLLAAERKWTEALAEFKQALSARPLPEAHYVVGCVYYQLGRDRLAVQYLRRAVAIDNGYAAAHYMLGLALWRTGDEESARESFSTALAADDSDPRYRQAAQRKKMRTFEGTALQVFGTTRGNRKRFLTGGDKRLAEILREDALGTTATLHEKEGDRAMAKNEK